MKNRVLMSYLKSMDPEAEVVFAVPKKTTRYNVTDVEEHSPSTIGGSAGKSKIILKGG